MGTKQTNAQASAASPGAMSQGIAAAFGDTGTEEEARKRKDAEDAAATAQGQQVQGQTPSVWDTMKSMSSDIASGGQAMAADPGSVWGTMTGQDSPQKKKK